MQIYLVGGAVRDKLLGLPIKDRDWVIVGATPKQLLVQGYQQVGKDFPVFLHPKTKEEYALARTERKAGMGYTGFTCDFSPDITLEQDLFRRDLTINAIAQDEQGNYYDPYNGINDLENRILRHISDAFSEDPLRVLRVARFAARYHSLGFTISLETLQLMQQIVNAGELQALTAERVLIETEKALNENYPEIYFETLQQVGALSVLFPEIEINTFPHTLTVLRQAVSLTKNMPKTNKSAVRFATVCVSLLHEKSYCDNVILDKIKNFCTRLKVPTYWRDLALLSVENYSYFYAIFELSAETVVTLFNRLSVWRKPERFQEFLLICMANMAGSDGNEQINYTQKEYLIYLYQAALTIDVQSVIADGFKKQQITEEFTRRRVKKVEEIMQDVSYSKKFKHNRLHKFN